MMRTKIVVWVTVGAGDLQQRGLVAMQLQPEQNRYDVWSFGQDVINETFVDAMMKDWRAGKSVDFPEPHGHEVRELSATEPLLPDGYKLERDADLLTRMRTEWLFAVLSHKVFETYKAELTEIKERVAALTTYDKTTWEELKALWSRISEQMRDRNIVREHADSLKDTVNELFDALKNKRSVVEDRVEHDFRAGYDKLNNLLAPIEERLKSGKADLVRIFGELKAVQAEYQNTKLARGMRDEFWKRIDEAFKTAKGVKFGEVSHDDRISKRLQGLKEAVARMEESIVRDNRELEEMQSRIRSGRATQIETQLNAARLTLTQERINSKNEKLADMRKTVEELERQLEKVKANEERIKQKAEQNELKRQEANAEAPKAEDVAPASEDTETPTAE